MKYTEDDVAANALRGIERALTPELLRAQVPNLAPPPRQEPAAYAQRIYREPQVEIDPIVKGLLAHLPESGSVWPEEARKLWLELLGGSFRLIYKEAEMPTPQV